MKQLDVKQAGYIFGAILTVIIAVMLFEYLLSNNYLSWIFVGSNDKTARTELFLTFLTTLIAAVAVTEYLRKLIRQRKSITEVKNKQFQAVFLSNGQVYFGKITYISEFFIVLENVYYMPQSKIENRKKLVKLGKEIHGPESQMFIHQDHVIFWENMRNDSYVSKIITEKSKR